MATQGKHAKANDVLYPVYSWFNEGFASADLVEAKRLLDLPEPNPPTDRGGVDRAARSQISEKAERADEDAAIDHTLERG